MTQVSQWQKKLDGRGRALVARGLLPEGVNVALQLTSSAAATVDRLKTRPDFRFHCNIGEIVTGHVANIAGLEDVCTLDCVTSVNVSSPLYADEQVAS